MAASPIHVPGLGEVDLKSALDERLAFAFIAVIGIAIITRVLSASLGASKKTPNGYTVPMAPYWLPVIGHIPNFAIGQASFFDWARKTYAHGAFALNLGGTTHNIIFKPALGHMLMNQKNEIADGASVSRYLMGAIFAWPSKALDAYDKALPDILACYKALLSNPSLSKLIDGTVREVKRNINSLVTFAESPVDMMYWERVSNPTPTRLPSGEQAQEVSLLHLLRDFVASNANPALFGTDFVNANQSAWADLWTLDSAFLYLAPGIGRWFPIPTLTRGLNARRRLLNVIKPYEIALEKWHAGQDPGSEWSDLDNVSDLIKERVVAYDKWNLSLEARASCELALLWAMNANANPLIFWIIIRVYSDPTLLEQMREEVAPYVKVREPKQEFAIAESPILDDIDHEGLATKCPLLKAAYVESLRLDTRVWSFKIMREDLALTSRDKDAQKFVLKKGTYCHVAHELHHRDEQYYDEPDVWRIARHITYEPSKDGGPAVAKADLGTVRPYGGGHSMCKGRAFALKEILIFVASIITFWDMEPASGEWKIPKSGKATGTNAVKGDVRVRIKRRQIPTTAG